ncbi:MAG TPA: tetratricopeptide repeat protein, partial [Vicinamibacteria bacterium]|nr:tetratricopeptide repeat protein [Vicinamibacteria bacterium]
MVVRVILSIGGLAMAGSIPGDGSTKSTSSGVVVEDVAQGSAGEKAGIRPGDVILSWSRPPAPAARSTAAGMEERIESAFDLLEVEGEQAARGPVTLSGRRGETPTAWAISSAPFGLTVRPLLTDTLLRVVEEGNDLVPSDKVAAARRWRAAATDAREQGQPLIAAWLLSRAGKALAEARVWPEADAAHEEAVREAERAAASRVASLVLRQWADTYDNRSEWRLAEERYQRAIVHDEKVGPDRLAIGYSRHKLGTGAWRRGDLAAAEEHYRRALALREREIPGALDVAKTLNNLGVVAHERGDLAAAEEYYRRALRIKEELVPGSADVASSVNNLGLIAEDRGDLEAAE